MSKNQYKTVWQVIDEEGKVLFEGLFREAESFQKKCDAKTKIVPDMRLKK